MNTRSFAVVKRKTPELDILCRRACSLTKQRGARARLAEILGVLPQTLNDWLRGRFEPGGEVTLKLQKWVVAAEAKQQKKTAAVLVTPQRRMTRSAKSKANEKVQPDRPKG